MIRAVIIDDMPEAREILQDDLHTHCPEIEIVGMAGSVVEAAKLLPSVRPDVVFLDIELEDGSGFDLLEILSDFSFKIIFITASDEHAIRAFRFSAIDYLLKPIDIAELREAVSRLEKDTPEKVSYLLENMASRENPGKLTLHNSDKILLVALNDIIRCEAHSNYTTFYFRDGSRFLVSQTLKNYEKLLEPVGFLRVHQSHLVNVRHVRSYEKSEGGYLLMDDQAQVPVAVRKRSLVLGSLSKF